MKRTETTKMMQQEQGQGDITIHTGEGKHPPQNERHNPHQRWCINFTIKKSGISLECKRSSRKMCIGHNLPYLTGHVCHRNYLEMTYGGC